jgi:hypothetical protein
MRSHATEDSLARLRVNVRNLEPDMNAQLYTLRDCQLEAGRKFCGPQVMESTAQYWRPVWSALEQYWTPVMRQREGAGLMAARVALVVAGDGLAEDAGLANSLSRLARWQATGAACHSSACRPESPDRAACYRVTQWRCSHGPKLIFRDSTHNKLVFASSDYGLQNQL